MFCFFFFQAEDGIRDLVRSRGLGDVYKRQREAFPLTELTSIKGIFNATTNVILSLMENGEAYDLSLIHI